MGKEIMEKESEILPSLQTKNILMQMWRKKWRKSF
jgi:hypothetical protein